MILIPKPSPLGIVLGGKANDDTIRHLFHNGVDVAEIQSIQHEVLDCLDYAQLSDFESWFVITQVHWIFYSVSSQGHQDIVIDVDNVLVEEISHKTDVELWLRDKRAAQGPTNKNSTPASNGLDFLWGHKSAKVHIAQVMIFDEFGPYDFSPADLLKILFELRWYLIDKSNSTLSFEQRAALEIKRSKSVINWLNTNQFEEEYKSCTHH